MVLVLGYYGFGNLGDEAILAALCTDLAALGVARDQIWVISGDPENTRKQHGTKAVGRFEFAEVWRLLKTSSCLIAGGGSLLQDVTSKRSIPYYLGLVELAFLRNVPVIMYGQGLGPIQSGLYRAWVKRAYNKSAAFSVRDQASGKFLQALGVEVAEDNLSADPVFLGGRTIRTAENGGLILLNLRPYQLWSTQQRLWVELIKAWQECGYTVEYLPLGPGDLELGVLLQKELPFLKIHTDFGLGKEEEVFSAATLFVSMRLHGIIFSVLQDVLPIALNYDPKVKAVAEQLAVPCVDPADFKNLGRAVEEFSQNIGEYQTAYRAALAHLETMAAKNRAILAKVLQQG